MPKQPATKLRETARLIQDEIIDDATRRLRGQAEGSRRPDFFVARWVGRGGLRGLSRALARDMLRLGNIRTEARPTARQQLIAAGLQDMRRYQRVQAVMYAIRGNRAAHPPLSDIRNIDYPLIDRTTVVVDERPFIDIQQRRTRLGTRAAALVFRMNPLTERMISRPARSLAQSHPLATVVDDAAQPTESAPGSGAGALES